MSPSLPTATAALAQNATQMASVRAALKRAGIADRDIQTSSINLNPDYRQDPQGNNPQIVGYRATNQVTVRFRDIAATGKILDALVAQGANQINGPMLTIDKPEAALDEARTKALAIARARAELYARALGKRVGRILSISEAGDQISPAGHHDAPGGARQCRRSTSTRSGETERLGQPLGVVRAGMTCQWDLIHGPSCRIKSGLDRRLPFSE